MLNTHKSITSTGEMEGWEYDKSPFYCSCGNPLEECPFYQTIQQAFVSNNLPFAFSKFGTAYRFSKNDRINRPLTESLPLLRNSPLERFRDTIIRMVPPFSTQMSRYDRANQVFISTALKYHKASVFVDASKNPFRLRHLRHIHEIKLHVLHLVRDPRGTIHSSKKNRGWETSLATRIWLREQANILRITQEFEPSMKIYYEDICNNVNESLAKIAKFVDLEPDYCSTDFKSIEHHVLGNSMRLSGPGKITKSERWKKELTANDLKTIDDIIDKELPLYKNEALNEIVHHYLGS